ncbi:unnamed protein product, partial [Polarella glacialis]
MQVRVKHEFAFEQGLLEAEQKLSVEPTCAHHRTVATSAYASFSATWDRARKTRLDIRGNALSEKVVCGRDRTEAQFPQEYTRTDFNRLFTTKSYKLGVLELTSVGSFAVCYCIANAGRDCDIQTDFEYMAGAIDVVGPNFGQTITAVAGVPFDVSLFGSGFSQSDRIRIIEGNRSCGSAGNISTNVTLEYLRHPLGNLSNLTEGFGPRNEGSGNYEVWWSNMMVSEASELAVCWCQLGKECNFDSDFTVLASKITVLGPTIVSQAAEASRAFDVLVTGIGGFKASDRLRLQDASVPCSQLPGTPDAALDAALPLDAAPCSLTPTSVRWCNVVVNTDRELVACWCGALGGFQATNGSGVLAVRLSVSATGATPVLSGPFLKPALASPPLSGSQAGWPGVLYSPNRSYTVRVELKSRAVPGASTTGPIDVQICESPGRCLPPVSLRELPGDGRVGVKESVVVSDGVPLQPRGVFLRSATPDPYLAEHVDVAVDGSWRRFPLNRWLLMQDAGAGSSWELLSPMPLTPVPPAETAYTEGDDCGGCGLGMVCRERPWTEVELARKAITNPQDTSVVTWNCAPACGDGFVTAEEQCDDGGLRSFDGCDSSCKVESGFECTGADGSAASVCRPLSCSRSPKASLGVDPCFGLPRGSLARETQLMVACRRSDDMSQCDAGSDMAKPRFAVSCVEEWLDSSSNWRCVRAQTRPQAVIASLYDGSGQLVVVFDAELAASGRLALECSAVFDAATVALLGDRAECTLGSSRHLAVRLGFGASLGEDEASRSLMVLDSFRQHAGLPYPLEVVQPWQFPAQRISLGPALSGSEGRVSPTVLLRGPSVASACGDVKLDASLSSGSGGRPWRSAAWLCQGSPAACDQVSAYLPNSCPPSGLAATGLGVGATACGLLMTVPEAVAAALSNSGATLTVSLRLTNVYGLWHEASHTLRFTAARIPLVVALSSTTVAVEPEAAVRLQLAVGPATPADASTAGSLCSSLGPVAVEWRTGADNLPEDLSQVWSSLSRPPISMVASHTAAGAVLEGRIGSLEVPGTNWTAVARVAHTSGGEVVFVPFRLVVPPLQLGFRLEAPAEVSEMCAFSVAAVVSPSYIASSVTWRCVYTDLVPGASSEASACAAAAAGVRSNVLGLPSLPAGVYQIEGTVDTTSFGRATATALVRVSSTAGPVLQISSPSQAVSLSFDGSEISPEVALQAKLSFGSCFQGGFKAAVVIFGVVPGETDAPSRPTAILGSRVLNTSEIANGGTVE